ncbi:MAG: hypothetical protein DMG01_21305 [Acidobacteria bacterium]|nr:MAG: hypothetical protein DMG01_21305 [Acidobacteriota bacterium]
MIDEMEPTEATGGEQLGIVMPARVLHAAAAIALARVMHRTKLSRPDARTAARIVDAEGRTAQRERRRHRDQLAHEPAPRDRSQKPSHHRRFSLF